MMNGLAKAAKSDKTPAHLKPHIEARMKANKAVFTGSKAKMGPYKEPLTPNTSAQAERLLQKPQSPFANPNGSVHRPVGKGQTLGSGDGKSKNMGGLMTGSKPTIAATGNTIPGGYSKVVGGQKGTSHPSKKTDTAGSLGVSAKRNAKFFGR